MSAEIKLTGEWTRYMTSQDITRVKDAFPNMTLTREGLAALEGHRFDAYSIARLMLDGKHYDAFWAAHTASKREMDYEVGQAALNMAATIETSRERLSLGELLPIIKKQQGIYDSFRAEWRHKHYSRTIDALLDLVAPR